MDKKAFIGFLRGNAIKYLCRVGKKGDAVEDLKKAQYYVDRLVEEVTDERLK